MTPVVTPKEAQSTSRPARARSRPGHHNGAGTGPADAYEQLRQKVLAEIQRQSGAATAPDASVPRARTRDGAVAVIGAAFPSYLGRPIVPGLRRWAAARIARRQGESARKHAGRTAVVVRLIQGPLDEGGRDLPD